MITVQKYILHSPLTDSSQLTSFVERCIEEEISLLAIVGAGCSDLENEIDCLVIGDGYDEARFLCTTSHPNESVEEVLSFVQSWEKGSEGKITQFRF